uniref:PI3K/PI4K domain-containing protein n=1 Tax=Strongyloides papillosus TaxID=174720 RepID=A0A0N5CJ07_STREA
MSNLNDSLDESSKFKLIQLRELLKRIDDALPLNNQQLLRYTGVLDRREKQQLPVLRGLLKGDLLLNSTSTFRSSVSSIDKLTLSPIKPNIITILPNQSSATISNKPKTMSYHFTLAVTKFSHTETSRKFSTFLSQLRDAFAIDGVTDENTKFPLLRSRFEDKAREMLPNKLP